MLPNVLAAQEITTGRLGTTQKPRGFDVYLRAQNRTDSPTNGLTSGAGSLIPKLQPASNCTFLPTPEANPTPACHRFQKPDADPLVNTSSTYIPIRGATSCPT